MLHPPNATVDIFVHSSQILSCLRRIPYILLKGIGRAQ
jgi:hypothetical protein